MEERVCAAGRGVLFIVAVSLVNLCSFLALLVEGCLISSSKLLGGGWEAGQATVFPRSFCFGRVNFFDCLDLSASQFMAVLGSKKLFFRIYLQVIVYVPVQC